MPNDTNRTRSEAFRDLITADDTTITAEETSSIPKEPLGAESTSAVLEAFDNTVTTLAPTAIEREILENAIVGLSVAVSAFKIGVPESHVRNYIRNPKVKLYIKELKEAINEIDQMMLTGTLRSIISARVDGAVDPESGEVDYAKLSNKDTLDIIKTFADISNQISKGQEADKSDDVFVNIYQQILSDAK